MRMERGCDTGARRPTAERGRFGSIVALSLMTMAVAPVFAPIFVAAAHAADDEDNGMGEGWSDRLSQRMKDGITSMQAKIGLGKAPGPPPSEAPSGCPTISILPGTESQRVMAAGASGNEGVRYQFSLANVGRECSIGGGRVSIKVGADGRVLLGPAGASGRFDVPIRVVVFSEIQQKPVESRLFRVPASIGSGQLGTPFQFVSDNLSVPVTAGGAAKDYSIKVGFDGAAKVDVGPSKKSRHAGKKAAPATAEAAAN